MDEMHLELLAYCKEKGIEFLSTPFDTESLEMLVRDCDVAQIKIPSEVLFFNDIEQAFRIKPDVVIFAVPSHVMRSVSEMASNHIKRKTIVFQYIIL